MELEPTTEVSSWRDEYSVSVPEVDDHHRELVKLIDELKSAVATGRGRDIYEKILKELADYTRYHFAYEESLMRRYKLDGFPEHQAAHAAFADDIQAQLKAFRDGGMPLSVVLLRKMMDWLTNHIMTTDRDCLSNLRSA